MNYASWTDDELRRVLGANPKDLDAVIEASRRFEVARGNTEFQELQDKIDEAEEKRADELQKEIDALHDAGAALL